ncbi:MAG TPA: lamin tail domain-containing protein, partial [Bacteroidales bacterium]|nr:lamin tail domain-containing protein [Bacteroidales bacterium]
MKKILLLIIISVLSLPFLQAQNDLFFSEYVEGTGNNKALEIYNPTDQAIDLTNYWILRFSNGSSSFDGGGKTQLDGIIQPYSTFVIVNGQKTSTDISPAADSVLQALADTLDHAYPAPTYMNGNDAIALVKNNKDVPISSTNYGDLIDLIGQTGLRSVMENAVGWSNIKDSVVTYSTGGDNPVQVQATISNYVVPGKSDDGVASFGPYWLCWTKDHVLIRKPDITQGVNINPDPFIVTEQWDTLTGYVGEDGSWTQVDNWSNLGTHACVADPNYSTAATEHISEDMATVYPNPVQDNQFTIKADRQIESFLISNMLGQIIYRSASSLAQKQITVDAHIQGAGIYFLKINFPNNQQV